MCEAVSRISVQLETVGMLSLPTLSPWQGYRQRVAFIVTQAPMENTIGDFWRMIWEQKSAAIVMLTELEEGGKVSDFGIALSCQLPALCLLCKPGPH